MTFAFTRGGYRVRLATTADDMGRAMDLRATQFRKGAPDLAARDSQCEHILIEARGRLLATFRAQVFCGDTAQTDSYAAHRYDLARVAPPKGALLELGRFAVAPAGDEAAALRLAWAAVTRMVDAGSVRFLFGCSSFAGTDPGAYRDAFGFLADRHQAPAARAPGRRAAETVPLAQPYDRLRALQQLPPLLRSYLRLGGWVSDHAVIDRDLGTLHVFTGLDVAAVPAARARALRALAA